LAMESAKIGVRSNAIAPYAWTRMFDNIFERTGGPPAYMAPLKQRIRSDQVGIFVTGLCADKETTGQIFAVRGNEIFLISQPRPVMGVGEAGGWTPESIVSRGLPALRPMYHDLKGTGDYLNWDPL